MPLREFQNEGVKKMVQWGSCINGDDMGLGKTVQAIASVLIEKTFPCLIVCPATMKENWRREIAKFTYLQGMVLTKDNLRTANLAYNAGIAHFFIINFEMLKIFVESINVNKKTGSWKRKDVVLKKEAKFFKSIIIDEAHRLKDPTAIQTKLAGALCLNINSRKLLTGTPVVNSIIDTMTLLAMIDQIDKLGGQKEFMSEFVDNRSEMTDGVLHRFLIANCFFQRMKSDVAKDLPDKTRQITRVKIENYFEYSQQIAEFKEQFKKFSNRTEARKAMHILTLITRLRQISGEGKLKWTKDRILKSASKDGGKLIVFVMFKQNMADLIEFCVARKIEYATIYGGMASEARYSNVDNFQLKTTCKVIICSLKAAGVGLNLTSGNEVIYNDLPWNWADAVQGEDRAFRIGQTNDVEIEYLEAVSPTGEPLYDSKIFNKIYEKRRMAETVTGNKDTYSEETVTDSTANSFFDFIEAFNLQ